MANVMRWRYGETAPVVAAVDTESTIEIGDLIWLDGGLAKPAHSFPPAGTAAATRRSFAAAFLGVAMQQSRRGESQAIRVATRGVFEFDVAATTCSLGQWVGLAIDQTSGSPLSQQVEKVTEAAEAIGRVAARSDRPTTKILVEICSTVMAGGVAGTTAPAS